MDECGGPSLNRRQGVTTNMYHPVHRGGATQQTVNMYMMYVPCLRRASARSAGRERSSSFAIGSRRCLLRPAEGWPPVGGDFVACHSCTFSTQRSSLLVSLHNSLSHIVRIVFAQALSTPPHNKGAILNVLQGVRAYGVSGGGGLAPRWGDSGKNATKRSVFEAP